MTKKELRAMVSAKKKLLSREEIESYSKKVCDILIQQPFYKSAKVIYPYLAYNQEIITTPLIEQAWRDGKEVAVPKTGDDRSMEFIRIRSFDNVELGYCDIPEPVSGEIADDKDVLILMPGLVFDKDFNRIGYGGGYYDRHLDRKSDCRFLKVSFAYDFQIVDHIETEEHDYKVYAIITAEGCRFSPEYCNN